MILIFREFRSRAGDEERLLTALRKHAAAIIRNRQAEAVLVCQRTDVPQHLLWIQHHVLWIQHHAGPGVPAVDNRESLPSVESGFVESVGEPVRVEFVDGVYQFPLPPCRVWAVETRDEETGRALLNVSRLAASDRRIGGLSVYRTTEGQSRMIAFVALAPDVAPGDYLKLASGRGNAEFTLYPLRVSWTIGRLTPGTPSSSLVRYPRAAFWARLGPVSPLQTAVVRPERMLETSAAQRS